MEREVHKADTLQPQEREMALQQANDQGIVEAFAASGRARDAIQATEDRVTELPSGVLAAGDSGDFRSESFDQQRKAFFVGHGGEKAAIGTNFAGNGGNVGVEAGGFKVL